jgi:hypothetical protein
MPYLPPQHAAKGKIVCGLLLHGGGDRGRDLVDAEATRKIGLLF